MKTSHKKTLGKFIQYIPIWFLLGIGRFIPFRFRGGFFAALGGFLIPLVPGSRKRILGNLKQVYPDMAVAEAMALCKAIGQNAARTLSEILYNQDFKKQSHLFSGSGPGLEALEKAHAEGRGAIIVSAHFGQWEAIRHFLKARGLETGAVYRENSNPWYETRFLAGIKQGGDPIVAKSAAGNMKMVRHLRKGGFFALLVDQKFQQGHLLPFLGVDGLTTTSPAELALRYDLPLVPAFGTRAKNNGNIDVVFEAPIEPSEAMQMTREVNDRISARILANPEQWYWLHKRWIDTELFEVLHGDKTG